MVQHAFPCLLLLNIHVDFLARQVIEACEAKGVHSFKAAFHFSGQVVISEELLSMLMLHYAADMLPVATPRQRQ